MDPMVKIRDLVKQLGGAEEMATALLEAMDNIITAKETELNEKYNARIEKAKIACLEETEKYKSELARKVEIFLEARRESVTREARKQAVIGESVDSKTLKAVKRLLEGVNLETKEDSQAADKLKARVARLEEEKKLAEQKVKRTNTICRKLIENTKQLQNKAPQINTSKAVTESKKQLEDLREESTPKTTRKVEKSTYPVEAKKTEQLGKGDQTIEAIASGLDGSPAYL